MEKVERQHRSKWLLKIINQHILRKIFRRLCRSTETHRWAAPTPAQRKLVLTGLMLGFSSIFVAFFPICGLPVAITGLLIGLYGRRTTALQMMSTWTILLSLLGLILTFLCAVMAISIYFSKYLLFT